MRVWRPSHDQGIPSPSLSQDTADLGSPYARSIEEAQEALQQVRRQLDEPPSSPDEEMAATLLHDLLALRAALHHVLMNVASQVNDLIDSSSVEDGAR